MKLSGLLFATRPLCVALILFILGLLASIPQARAASIPDDYAYPWLYLRQAKPLDPVEPVVEVLFVGDIMLGRQVARIGTLDQVTDWLSHADLSVGNLESVLAGSLVTDSIPEMDQVNTPIILSAPSSAVNHLLEAGFDILGMANNHALDLGSSALLDTYKLLRLNQIAVTGLRTAHAEPEPVIATVDGLRIAFLAFTRISPPNYPGQVTGLAPVVYQAQQADQAVKSARLQADIVVVMMHWGEEYTLNPTPAQRQIAQDLTAAGVDLVVGSHPHVVQSTFVKPADHEQPRDRFVAFSLGNFMFDQPFTETRQGLALRVFFDQDGLRAVQALPVRSGERPVLLLVGEAEEWLQRADPLPQVLSFTCAEEECHSNPATQTKSTGLFNSGEIDLTGDGISEQIFRRGERALIFEGNRLVWQSPLEWQVLDLALGDPNSDGRGELLISLRKQDGQGIERSHPFIIGYRRGTYRLLWGGSAVSDPISEVELFDINGDGEQELVDLEERGQPGQQTLAIWRWHGWGFSLLWRSSPDWYENLGVSQPAMNQQQAILVDRRWGPP